MAVAGFSIAGVSPRTPYAWKFFSPLLLGRPFLPAVSVKPTGRRSSATVRTSASVGSFQKKSEEFDEETNSTGSENPYAFVEEALPEDRKSLKDWFEEVGDLLRSAAGGDDGPPRWFSPLECGARAPNSPLLLFLPGIDGTGLGLIRHHRRLGEIFDIWCLHIPVMDRTPLQDLVKLVERMVRSESYRFPNRPIYIVGEFLGACLALDVAARNPDVDLVLILANPATPSSSTMLQPLASLLDGMPNELPFPIQQLTSFNLGDPLRMVMDIVRKGFPLQQTDIRLSQDLVDMSTYLTILAGILPIETLIWKLRMLKSASASANSRLHAVKAQVLILSSAKHQWSLNPEEIERLYQSLPNCEIRRFNENGQFLFLEDDIDLVSVIKGASFYRRGKHHDYASDYMPPTPFEFKKARDPYKWLLHATSPVMLSTLQDGTVVNGLAGIPSEGPVLYVGYHGLLGFDMGPLVIQVLQERNILLRGMAHPLMFIPRKDSKQSIQSFDPYRVMGAVPVSPSNFYKLLSSKSHVLLFPGGAREALHRKGEDYKLFWPEHSEFVRVAARFGARIVPFGAVGEDDICELILDYDDQMKIPFLRSSIEELRDQNTNLRAGEKGELGNQDMYLPGIVPKFPGRFYYYFSKPIETAGRKGELRDREKAHELYLQVKLEVERCINYLKEKRETDPYRSLMSRLLYQTRHGFHSQVPTFEL